MLDNIRKYIGILFLIVIVGIVSYRNYVPGTMLTGIDNFHVEYDLNLAWRRSVNSAWQEFQGVGSGLGLAQAVELPRIAIESLLALLLPLSAVRYAYVLLSLLIGVTGAYFLYYYFFSSGIGAFFTGLFYLINLATVQQFYMPIDMFVTQYAALPWLVLTLLRYLKKGDSKNLILLVLVNLLAIPQAMTPTVMVSYLLSVIVFSGYYAARNKSKNKRKKVIRRIGTLLAVLVAVHTYWALPFVRLAISGSGMVIDSKINNVFSEENYLQNKARGGVFDVITLRGAWFDYPDYVQGEYVPLLHIWSDHLKWIGFLLPYALFAVVVVGGIGLFKSRWKHRYEFLTLVAVSYFFLANERGVLGWLYAWMREWSIFAEVLRFPFTKISVFFVLLLAVMFGHGVSAMTDHWEKVVKRFRYFVVIVAAGTLMYFGLPIFRGELFNDGVRVSVPEEYFELFDYTKTLPLESRMALLPVQKHWAWIYTNWGYRGSGFLWYGVEQPILDRAFDVWSKYNETFYHEISRAVYSGDTERMGEVLDKYDVRYVLVDESVIEPGKEKDFLRFDESKEMLRSLGGREVFCEGFLSVWQMDDSYAEQNSFVDAPSEYTFLQGDTVYGRSDELFGSAGDYVEQGDVCFPFADLMREKVEGVSYRGDVLGRERVVLERDLSGYSSVLYVPPFTIGTEVSIPVSVLYENGQIKVSFEPSIRAQEFSYPELGDVLLGDVVGDELILGVGESLIDIKLGSEVRGVVRLRVGEPVPIGVYSKDLVQVYSVSEQFMTKEVTQCWTRDRGDSFIKSSRSGNELTITTRDAAGCVSLRLGDLKDGIVDVSLPYLSHDGSRPNFCLNEDSEQYECLHDDVFYSTGPSSSWSSVARRVSIESGEYWLDVTARPSDVVGEQWSIDYQIPSIFYYPQILNVVVEVNFFESMLNPQKIELVDTDKLILEIITLPVNIDYGLNGKGVAENCDVLGRGAVSKVVEDGQVVYKANDGGAACDGLLLSKVSQSGEYFMRFRGGQIKGRSLKSYLYSPNTLRNEMEVLLPQGEYDASFAVLSQKDCNTNYSMSVETRSFGQDAEHRIDEIGIYPVPIFWLSGMRLGEDVRAKNSFSFSSVEKFGTWMYRVEGEIRGEQGMVTLSQGYDESWIAWIRGGSHRFLEHVRVNGWKNGWIVDDSEGSEIVIMMVYWPQLLQWLGLGLMIVTIVILIVPRRKKRH